MTQRGKFSTDRCFVKAGECYSLQGPLPLIEGLHGEIMK